MLLLAGLLLVQLGCGGSGNEESAKFISTLVPVTGTVTLDDQPLSGVLVTFVVDDTVDVHGEMATALTNEEGKYELGTFVPGSGGTVSPGAVPGDYRVTITKLVMPNGDAVPADTMDADAQAMGAKQLLPPKYSDASATKLRAKVSASESNVIDFNLEK